MATKLKLKDKPKRKPVDGHKQIMLNLPDSLAEQVDQFVEEDEYTSRAEWLRNEIRKICQARKDAQ